jgi:hypothetical protein
MKANLIKADFMMKNTLRYIRATNLLRLLAIALVTIGLSTMEGRAQQSNEQKEAPSPKVGVLGPAADSIRPYKPAGRDPFKKVIKPKPVKPGATGGGRLPREVLLGFPTLEVRRAEYRQKVERARDVGVEEPNPVSQYLIAELTILGVFRDDQGYGAFVRAQPTGTMFFIRRGTACYNGEVMRIETDEADIGTAKVVFREVAYAEVGGKQVKQERMVAKVPGAQQAK